MAKGKLDSNWVLEATCPKYMHGWERINIHGQTRKNLTFKKAFALLGQVQKVNKGWEARIVHQETGDIMLGCL